MGHDMQGRVVIFMEGTQADVFTSLLREGNIITDQLDEVGGVAYLLLFCIACHDWCTGFLSGRP